MHDASQLSPYFSLLLLAFMAMHVQMHTFTQIPRLECWCADFSRGTEILNQGHHHGPELRNRGVSGTTRERPSRTFPSQDGHTPLMNTDSHETLRWSRPLGQVHPPCLGASDTLVFRGVRLQTAIFK